MLKGRDGSLEYVLPGGERFTFAGRSRDAEQKTLGGWLRFAVNDLRYNAQTRSAEAKAAVAAQIEQLEARLSVDGPFAVRASDPNVYSEGGAASAVASTNEPSAFARRTSAVNMYS